MATWLRYILAFISAHFTDKIKFSKVFKENVGFFLMAFNKFQQINFAIAQHFPKYQYKPVK